MSHQKRNGASGLLVDLRRSLVEFDGEDVPVSATEFDVLAYCARTPDRCISRDELLREVWHYTTLPSDTRTPDAHITRLRSKLSALGGRSLLQNRRGRGWILALDPGLVELVAVRPPAEEIDARLLAFATRVRDDGNLPLDLRREAFDLVLAVSS